MVKQFKICSNCKHKKLVGKFYYRSDKPHLLQSHCKDCIKTKRTSFRNDNIERIKERDRKYHWGNREKRIEYLKKYRVDNTHIRNVKYNARFKSDVFFRMSQNIRTRIRMALKRNTKSKSTQILIGCTIDFLRQHLQNQFKEGMDWNNYGLWQIDHKKPCSLFDLSKEEEQLKCFHYSNLQPLWATDNRKKHNRYNEEEVCHR